MKDRVWWIHVEKKTEIVMEGTIQAYVQRYDTDASAVIRSGDDIWIVDATAIKFMDP